MSNRFASKLLLDPTTELLSRGTTVRFRPRQTNWSSLLFLTVIFASLCASAQAQTTFVFEAEDYTTKSSLDGGTHNWTLSTTTSGYSGTGYMDALPNSGNCTNTPPTVCGADITYDFTVTVPGTYYVHFLVNAVDASEDSLHWGIDTGCVPEFRGKVLA